MANHYHKCAHKRPYRVYHLGNTCVLDLGHSGAHYYGHIYHTYYRCCEVERARIVRRREADRNANNKKESRRRKQT